MRLYLLVLSVLTALVVPFPTGLARFEAAAGPPRATVLGYSREEFGEGWEALDDGCTTRTAAMAQAFRSGTCRTQHRQWDVAPIPDPYTGRPLVPADVEIDHLVPLSAAWDLGAHAWAPQRRREFANDPRNLVVTSAVANQAKSDQLPSEWLPPQRRARCAYARRLVAVATEYDLALPAADLRAARRSCAGVAGLAGRRELAPSQAAEARTGAPVP